MAGIKPLPQQLSLLGALTTRNSRTISRRGNPSRPIVTLSSGTISLYRQTRHPASFGRGKRAEPLYGDDSR